MNGENQTGIADVNSAEKKNSPRCSIWQNVESENLIQPSICELASKTYTDLVLPTPVNFKPVTCS